MSSAEADSEAIGPPVLSVFDFMWPNPGIDAPKQYGADGQLLANPRNITNVVFKTTGDGPINDKLTMAVMQWGQVTDHEMTKTPRGM